MEQHLSYQDQLLLLKNKGIAGINANQKGHFDKQVNSIRIIGYYKLKQYAYIFWNNKSRTYEHITFDNLITRYYRDQSLKHEVFQAIGDIETALNNEISYILGRNDPYLYLKFQNWCQITGRNPYLGIVYRGRKGIGIQLNKFKIQREELLFLSQLQSQVKKSNNLDIKSFEKENSTKVFPTIWLAVNTLTFGQSIYLAKLMSPLRRRELSNKFFHQNTKTLIKNLELLNLIRNICCHTGNLVDISLKTMPPVLKRYEKYLNMENGNFPHRLAIVIVTIMDLMYALNKKYDWHHLQNRLQKICKLGDEISRDSLAQEMGFKDYASIKNLLKTFHNNRIITFYPDGRKIYR